MFSLPQLRAAHEVVRTALQPTPALSWPLLARRLGTEVIVKHENHNPTGAFKVRGGLTFVDALQRRKADSKGLVSATRGNHGQSLAFAAGRAGLPVTIYVPRGNSVEKNAAMRALGAELVEHGDDFQAAREEAIRVAQSVGLDLVPAFHTDLVLGVATYALELLGDRPDLDILYVPVGQGSGVCGCIAARDALRLRTEIVAVQSAEAPAYALSIAAGHVVRTDSADTLADGIATRVPDEDALAVIRRGVARFVLVGDADIADAMRAYWTDTHNLTEGAGAAALAAAVQEKQRLAGKKVGLVLSGGNIDFDLFLAARQGKSREPYALGAGRQRTGRARARGRAVLGALVQHRELDGRRGGARDPSVAHHDRDLGHARNDRAGAPPVGAARPRPFRDRSDLERARGRARTRDGEGARPRRQPRRGAATRRGVPRQGDRCDDGELHLRDHGRAAQDRRFRRFDAADRPGRGLAHRRRGDLARAGADLSGLTLQAIVGEVHPSTPFPNRAFRHGRARPVHPRGSHSGRSEVFLRLNDVDGRDKPGHDDATAVRSAAAP